MNLEDAIRGAAEEIARNMWGCQRGDMSCNPDCERYGECRDCVEECNAILTRRFSPLLAAKNEWIAELAGKVGRWRDMAMLLSVKVEELSELGAELVCAVHKKEHEFHEHMQRVNEHIEQGCRRTRGDIVLPE